MAVTSRDQEFGNSGFDFEMDSMGDVVDKL
jgi:hypothetical protein